MKEPKMLARTFMEWFTSQMGGSDEPHRAEVSVLCTRRKALDTINLRFVCDRVPCRVILLILLLYFTFVRGSAPPFVRPL